MPGERRSAVKNARNAVCWGGCSWEILGDASWASGDGSVMWLPQEPLRVRKCGYGIEV